MNTRQKITSNFVFAIKESNAIPRIHLPSNNIEALLQQIMNRENLFDVIPGLKHNRFKGITIDYALFERREGIITNGKTFQSEQGYQQVGHLLIPHYKVVSRNKIELMIPKKEKKCEKGWLSKLRSMLQSEEDVDENTLIYSKLLSMHPDIKKFYVYKKGLYEALTTDKVFVLKKHQLQW